MLTRLRQGRQQLLRPAKRFSILKILVREVEVGPVRQARERRSPPSGGWHKTRGEGGVSRNETC